MDGFISLAPSDLTTSAGVAKLNNMLDSLFQSAPGDGVFVSDFTGYGSPNGQISASIGATYRQIDGTASTSFWVKTTSGVNTGWVSLQAGLTTPISVANGGTGGDFSATPQGYVPFFSATGVISALAPGTNGQVLVTEGASANPQWGTIFTAFTAGDYFVSGNFRAFNATDVTPTKVLEVYINRGGTLRIKFYLTKTGGTTGFGQIYRNGSAVGTLQSTATEANFSEDISGWSPGDLVQLYTYNSNGAQNTYGIGLTLYEGTPLLPAVNYNTYQTPFVYKGSITPVSNFNGLGNIGDIFMLSGGGASTTLFVKTAASTWTAK